MYHYKTNLSYGRELGQDIKNPIQREAFLKDNCDACEQKGYMKPYTPEELQGHKEKLANVSIEIAEIEAEKKQVEADFKGRLKPLKESRAIMVSNIKSKAEYVNGVLPLHRPRNQGNPGITTKMAFWLSAARQPPMNYNQTFFLFRMVRKTGTND